MAEEKTGQYNNENCEGTAESGGRYIKIYNNFEWRNIKRELLTKAETATTDALLLIHHKVPALLGGGEITVHCEGTFGGTVGTGAKDETKQFKGNKGEETKINCEASSSTNSLCKSGELVLVTAVDLPWKTELAESGESTVDNIESDGSGEPGYKLECKSITTTCTGKDRAHAIENSSSGAVLEFFGELTATCSDGGTSTTLGHMTVLGFLAI